MSTSYFNYFPINFHTILNKIDLVLKNIIVNNIIDNNPNIDEPSLNNDNKFLDYFCLKKIPHITLKDYIWRIISLSKIQENTLLFSFTLIDKFINKSKIILNYSNVYLIVLISMSLSLKYHEDIILNDKSLTLIGMIDIKTFSKCEAVFLNFINYSFMINEKDFNTYKSMLINN